MRYDKPFYGTQNDSSNLSVSSRMILYSYWKDADCRELFRFPNLAIEITITLALSLIAIHFIAVFSRVHATLYLTMSVRLSIRPSVCP